MKKLFPVGPECFANSKMDLVPELKARKVFHSPFNGSRVHSGFSGFFPQREFLLGDREAFWRDWLDRANWRLCTCGDETWAVNEKVNLRRKHLNAESLDKVLAKARLCRAADPARAVFVMNADDDACCWYDVAGLQRGCRDAGIPLAVLWQEKYRTFVDPDDPLAFRIGEGPLGDAVEKFYRERAADLLALL